MVYDVYRDFGFENAIDVKLSTRPDERIGSDEIWDKSEQGLADALIASGLEYEIQEGEGAFYGPKIEFTLYDCLNRAWQCGTIQLDFSMPGRLGAKYVDEHGERQTPVMIHRAVLGSLERFIGILIEHYAGAMPAWLAPQQVAILNITDKQSEYCKEIEESLKKHDIRASADLRNEKIGFKIREHTLHKVPYLIVVGDKEVESNTVAVRTRKGDDLGTMTLDAFKELLAKDVARRGRVETE
jgi:threonyl-tRNA synthetase